ncbi:MAG: 1-deoxy-D-xylulose-5-phosphate synthase [Nocardioidaceae bacterium]
MTTQVASSAGLLGRCDVRALTEGEVARLAHEIRSLLVSSVTRTGGHLGPNLGVVELTIALHRVFDSPTDPIVWDTGHQAYVHKLLTGRADAFGTLRQPHGLSGYPNRNESVHDVVENSHASTALSYADGLAKSFEVLGTGDRRVVAVIGDGAMTGGLAWEALNNIGRSRRPLVVVLNDNGRSYAPTVGALAHHLAELRAGEAAGNVFRDLGVDYLGPVDGHDVAAMEVAMRAARSMSRPVVVHCVTRKGAGYAPAETDEADRLHTVPPVTPSGAVEAPPSSPAWTDVFADELVRIGERRRDVVAVTAAMLRPTGLHPFACRYPDRVYDVGIAEQHAVASAAGLATGGLHPVVAIYSTFLNRAYDQVLMDVALHRMPVTFVLDRAGITGPDGPSHHGIWDTSLLGSVPGIRIAAPRDATRLRAQLDEAVEWAEGPTVVRFPRGRVGDDMPALDRLGAAELLTEPGAPADVLLLPVGPLAREALAAVDLLARDGIRATVVDPCWIAPIDPTVLMAAADHHLVVTVEDNTVAGGFGETLCRGLRSVGIAVPVLTLGLAGGFVAAGERAALLAEHGLDAGGIARAVRRAR